ncbi:hypothetical protein D3Y57_14755 [Sphingomonas paeninsulae]|uniref:Outer membrane beta-barrel protein n=1 Tax=Sphingomonas paeninsulae TaxID=2319844 RepID=A0A494TBY9_SPHPE|nr:outer membrane beta-barrel protein [Sphingomonas paeninsulae]AYJ86969.1 hypothetical protein D3Y57_14755 [Sphingomonas paeninsulae]
MKILSFLALSASVTTLIMATPAAAQTVISGQGVADRARPDYDPLGTPLGSFTLLPAVTATASATNNYLATDTDQRSDVYLSVTPEVVVRSNWSRNQLQGRVYVTQDVHANLTSENATQYGASLAGAYDISRETQVRADVSAGRFVESRSSLGSFQGSVEPVRYEVYHAGIGASRSFNELSLNANTSVEYHNYHDAELAGGLVVDQNFRDDRVISVGGSAQYDLRNGLGLIFTARYDDDLYNVRPGKPSFLPGDINRDSTGLTLQGGITLELTRLVFGNVQVGYLSRKYHDPLLNNVGGLSYNADVLWNVTPLTSIRVRASRSVEDSSSPDFAGNTLSDFSISVDHELYRYIIISGNADYGHFTPNGIGIGGNQYSVGAGARYLINRHFSVSGNVGYAARTSDSTYLRYNAFTGSIAVRFAL